MRLRLRSTTRLLSPWIAAALALGVVVGVVAGAWVRLALRRGLGAGYSGDRPARDVSRRFALVHPRAFDEMRGEFIE